MDESAVEYSFKASLIGSASVFRLTDRGLAWQAAGRSGVWPYSEISRVHLSYKPVSMQARRFRADIFHRDGGRVRLLSTSWQTVTLMAPQDAAYRNFITELHARMAEAGSKADLRGGFHPVTYAGALLFVVLLAVALVGLLIRSVMTGQGTAALFLVGFAALFAWQVGGFIRRNRPIRYSLDHLPMALLP